jgi:hypothetical protein
MISTVELSEPVVHLADAMPMLAQPPAATDVFVGVTDFGGRGSSTEPDEPDDAAGASVDGEPLSGDDTFDTDEFVPDYSSRGVDEDDLYEDDGSVYCDEAAVLDGASLLDDLRDENERLGAVLQRNLESCKALLSEVSIRAACDRQVYFVSTYACACRMYLLVSKLRLPVGRN